MLMARLDCVVRGGTVVSSAGSERVDIGIADGRIVELGDLAGREADSVIDAAGRHVLPGAIDTQVHFREPGLEHKEDIESGTRAAVVGGVTTIFEMPNTNPPTISELALNDKLQRAEGRASCDYAFFIGATTDNIAELQFLEMLPGSPGIKMFAGSSTGNLLVGNEEYQRQVMQAGSHRMSIHSEDETRLAARNSAVEAGSHARIHPDVRDVEAAVLSTKRLLRLAEETLRPIHILHISTAQELDLILEAKRQGIPVTCEATPHHLSLGMEDYETLGTLVQMNPPVRGGIHRDALWEALTGGLIDVLGSDHAPHTREEKSKPYPESPSGMTGVQIILPMMLHWVNEGRLELGKLVELLMENPVKLFGIVGKGKIEPGYDADLAVVDLSRRWTIQDAWIESKSQWTPYDGWEIRGFVESVLVRGVSVVASGRHLGVRPGHPVRFEWKE